MKQKIVFHQYNPNKSHRCGLLLKSLNDARFPYSYKAVPYAAKPKAGDGSYYLNSTIDYIKYLVTEIEADQPNTGITISTNHPYISIESTNWLLERGIATVRTLQKGRSGIPSELIAPKTKRFLVQFVNLKSRRKTFSWHLTPSKQSQKERKMFLCYPAADHCKAKQLMMVKKIPKQSSCTTSKKV